MRLLRALLIGYFVIFAGVLAFLTPVYEAPDEVAHVDYMNFLSRHGELPNQYVPEKAVPWEGHQPPLYYVFGAFLIHTFKHDHRLDVTLAGNKRHTAFGGRSSQVPRMNHLLGQAFPSDTDRVLFYSLRLFSVLLGGITLLYLSKVADLVLRCDRWSIFPLLFAATLPQFAFMSGAINNDSLANLLGAAAIYYLFRLAGRPAGLGNYVAVGICIGLGLLTKKSLLCLVPGAVFVPGCLVIRHGQQRGRILAYTLVAAALVLALSGWVFYRNQQLYGDLLGTRMERETMPGFARDRPFFSRLFFGDFASDLALSVQSILGVTRVQFHAATFLGSALFFGFVAVAGSAIFIAVANALLHDIGRAFALWATALCLCLSVFHHAYLSGFFFSMFLEGLFVTFIGLFGYLVIGVRHEVYAMYAFLFMLAAVGVGWRLLRERHRDIYAAAGVVIALTFFAAVVRYTMSYANVQGRWLYPALAPISLLLAFGLRQIVGRFGRAAEIATIAAAAVGFVVADALTVHIINVFYYQKPESYL